MAGFSGHAKRQSFPSVIFPHHRTTAPVMILNSLSEREREREGIINFFSLYFHHETERARDSNPSLPISFRDSRTQIPFGLRHFACQVIFNLQVGT